MLFVGKLLSSTGAIIVLAMSMSAQAEVVDPAPFLVRSEGEKAATTVPGDRDRLLELPLEDLLTLESTSVAKKRQRVDDSAAAVFVMTQEDISRSTASSIPDLLRMVPGVEVADIQSSATAVSIRGFNSLLSNTVLVMIDGRTVYVSAVSGVLWDQQLIPLSDIERIEVVRGTGATLWGNNAVNGIINIISKHSSDSQGGTAEFRAGTRKRTANLSYGGRHGDALSYRLYASGLNDEGTTDAQGHDLAKPSITGAIGTRVDFQPDARNAFTLQSDYSHGRTSIAMRRVSPDLSRPAYEDKRFDGHFEGVRLLGRWARTQSELLDWSLQANFDHGTRRDLEARMARDLADMSFGLRWKASRVHEFSLGLDARVVRDRIDGNPGLYFAAPAATEYWFSGYVQDDISLVPDRLRLTLGSKIEHNRISGVEAQPSAKLFARLSSKLALWGGYSRAMRTPSRLERNFTGLLNVFPGSVVGASDVPVVQSWTSGSPDLKPERLNAYEMGLRAKPGGNWSLDVSAFLNDYSHILTVVPVALRPILMPGSGMPMALRMDSVVVNGGRLRTYGIEAAISGRLMPYWKVDIALSQLHCDPDASAADPAYGVRWVDQTLSPKVQVNLRNAIDIGDRISVDAQLRYVGELANGAVGDRVGADLRLSWRPVPTVELSLIGENLIQARQQEYLMPNLLRPDAYAPRSLSGQVRLRF
jgi:iron complex outermembrane receptor protein